MPDQKTLQEALQALRHPHLLRSLGDLQMLPEMRLEKDSLHIRVDFLTAASPAREQVLELLRQSAHGLGVRECKIESMFEQRSTQPALGAGLLQNVRNLVAIASGKGGVGKSTVSSNVACALAAAGARVGLLDADVYGPSIPAMMGLFDDHPVVEGRRILPVQRFGLKVMSLGLLMKPGESVIWRGPMLHGLMQQFCKDVEWGELDFLVIDLPPGTGDVSLSLSQLVPLGGAAVVSTPQDVALGVATKAVNMFRKLNVPILGLIENMSYYCCPHCNGRDDLFGHGGTREAAGELQLPFLGEVPLNGAIRKAGDEGMPVVLAAPESAPAKALRAVAESIAGHLAMSAVLGDEALVPSAMV